MTKKTKKVLKRIDKAIVIYAIIILVAVFLFSSYILIISLMHPEKFVTFSGTSELCEKQLNNDTSMISLFLAHQILKLECYDAGCYCRCIYTFRNSTRIEKNYNYNNCFTIDAQIKIISDAVKNISLK